MSELHRRHRKKYSIETTPSVEAVGGKESRKIVSNEKHSISKVERQQNEPRGRREKTSVAMTTLKVLLLVTLYPIYLAFVNPFSCFKLYNILYPKVCQGICDISSPRDISSSGGGVASCAPVDPFRLIFIRIPKTASSSIVELIDSVSVKKKSVNRVALDEVGEIVTELSVINGRSPSQGYYISNPRTMRHELVNYYKKTLHKILYPAMRGYSKVLYSGHLHHHDWTRAWRGFKESIFHRHLPSSFVRFYEWETPNLRQMQNIVEFTLLRRPQDRLESMYYYDRSIARDEGWRTDLMSRRGNVTLEQCLLDPDCVEQNELKRCCSLQTEMLCGIVHRECGRDYMVQNPERALDRVKDTILQEKLVMLVGIMDRMEDTLSMLEHFLPTYLEGISSVFPMPWETKGPPRERGEFSSEAQSVLDEVCAVDNELYQFVNDLLTERMSTCMI